jgi:acyl-CoA reductase-like NAD-dependent aldehyde dehydrogenase
LQNPKDESKISSNIKSASSSDVDKAVDFATEAFETGPWSKFTGVQRGKCLNKLADLIEEHGEELAYLESIASGRPVSMVKLADISRSADVWRCEY